MVKVSIIGNELTDALAKRSSKKYDNIEESRKFQTVVISELVERSDEI